MLDLCSAIAATVHMCSWTIKADPESESEAEGDGKESLLSVSFQWKNPDFLLKTLAFLLRDPDFLLKMLNL